MPFRAFFRLYFVVGVSILFRVSSAQAAAITSIATGNWSGAATSAWPLTNRTGTLTSSNVSTAVTGVSTLFLTELTIGNVISTQGGTAIGTVSSITDNTHLILTGNAANTVSGQTYRSNGVGPGDSATIASGNTVTMDVTNATISSLTMASASAANGLSITSLKTLTVTNALTFATDAAAFAQTITLNGSANLNAGSIVTSAASAAGTSVITCAAAATGTLNVTNDIALVGSGFAGGAKIDFGTTASACNVTAGTVHLTGGTSSAGLLKLGTGILTLNGALTGAGTLANAQLTTSGIATIALNNGTIGTGETLSIFAGTKLTSDNTSSVTYATSVTTWGLLTVNSGTLTYSTVAGTFIGITIAGSATLNSGTILITNSGNYTNNGTHSGSGGMTMTGAASILDGTGSYSNTGTLTLSTANKSFAATANLTIAGTLALNGSFSFTNNGTVTITSAGGMTGSVAASTWVNAANSTLNISGPLLQTGTLTATANPNLINYTGAAPALKVATHFNLTLSGSGAATGAVTTVSGTLTSSGTVTWTTTANLAVAGNLFIGSGTTLTTGANFTLGVTGTTSVFGTLANSNTGIKTYTGLVTINPGASWTNANNAAVNFAGGFINNSGTALTMGTGTHTFTGTQSISGGNNITFGGAVGITGAVTVTNNSTATVTITGALTGTVAGSTWLQGANSTLLLGAAVFTTGTLTATASPNTVQYTGAAQAIKVAVYDHLVLSGSGAATGAVVTIHSDLTTSGTVNWTTGASMTVGGNLSIGLGSTLTTGVGFTLGVTGTTSVSGTMANSNAGLKTYTGAVIINSGGAWTNASNSAITFGGGFTNNKGSVIAMGSGTHTFNATQIIDGTSGITFGGVVAISGAVTVTNNNDQTVTVTGNMTGTVTGSSWVQGTNATLSLGAAMLGTGTLDATASPNTVQYTGAAQAIKGTTYDHLILSGSGAATGAVPAVNSDLTTSGTVNWTTGANMTVDGNLSIGSGSTLTTGANFTLDVTGTTSITGTLANSNTGAKSYTGAVTVNSGGNWTNANNSAVTFSGGFTNNKGSTLTMGSGTHTLDNDQILDGTGGLTFGGVVAISGAVTITNNNDQIVAITGNLTGSTGASGWTQGANSTLAVGGSLLTTGTLDASVSSNTVQYTGASQAINVTMYDHLTLSGSGVATGAVNTVNSDLTMSGTVTWTAGDDLEVGGSLTVNTGATWDSSVSNFAITVSSDVNIHGGTLNLNASNAVVTQDWSFTSGTFNAGTSTVLFNGPANSTSTFTGSSAFYNLQCVTPNKYLLFTAGSTTTVNNVFTSSGTAGNPVRLKSTTNGTAWSLHNGGSENVSFLSVQDSDARSGMMLTCSNNCVDVSNNKNWDFGGVGITRTWWGTVDTVWSNSSNWDTGVPVTSKDSALIVSTATRMPTLTAAVHISTLSIVATSSVTLNGFNLTLSSFTNAGLIVLKGSEQISTVPANVAGSTVVYNATSGTVPILSTWTYSNLWINGPGGTFASSGDMSVGQGFTITAGTYLHGNDTLTFTAPSGTYGITTNTNHLYNAVFNGAGTWLMQDFITLDSSLTLTAGTLNTKAVANNGIAVGGEWINTNGTFVANNSSVTFTGSGSNLRIMSNAINFWRLAFTGSGSWVTDTDPITVSSTVFINNGTLTVTGGSSMTVTGSPFVGAGGTLDIEGALMINGGALLNLGTTTGFSTATLTLNGVGILGGAGVTVLPSLSLIGGAVATTLNGPITLLGSMTNAATHSLDASVSNYGITLNGNWANSGSYNARSSSVTFSGSIANGTIATNTFAFFNLGFSGGVWRNITNTVTVANNLVMNGGSFSMGGSSLTVTGDVDINTGSIFNINNDVLINGGDMTNDGTITSLTTATVSLNGVGTLGGNGTTSLPKLTLGGTTTLGGDIVLLGSTTISATHSLDVSASNYQITISSWFANNGATFNARAGTVVVNSTATLTGSTTFYNFTATTPGITMTFQTGTTQYVTNAWTIAGASGNLLKFRSTTGAAYTFRVSISSFASFVDVQNCVSSSQTIYAGQSSTNSGGNARWVFDFPPNTISTLNATAQTDGDIWLTWTAAGDPDDNPLGVGSQYTVEWSTYTAVIWSTSTVGDTGAALTSHFFISTSAVSTGNSQIFISTGLTANVTYYFQIWTKDPLGTWSLGLSNQDNAFPATVLGMSLSLASYDFTTVNLTATTVSTSAVVITNLGNVTQTYSLAVATTGPSGIWGVKVATPTVLDHFVVFAGFNATVPGPAAFTNIDALTNTSTASTAGIFAIGQTGVSTPIASTRSLWFRLDMPPTTTTTAQQQMTMTITASTP